MTSEHATGSVTLTTSSFVARDGLRLATRHWAPAGQPKASLAIVHGYAEHCGRYDYVARRLAAVGCDVHAFDLRGHGQSEGERTLVRSLSEHLDDLDQFLGRVRHDAGARPVFVLGHSMGGAIVTLAAITRPLEVRGLILSAPAIATGGRVAALLGPVVTLLGRLFPKLPVATLNSADVSRDPAVVSDYDSDPLNYRGRVRAGLAGALTRANSRIRAAMEHVALPLLILHGSEDKLADPTGSRDLHTRASSRDKTLKIYDGLYHEILNEPERDQVIADIIAWIDARLSAASAR